jgi:hypothetical protein
MSILTSENRNNMNNNNKPEFERIKVNLAAYIPFVECSKLESDIFKLVL